MDLDLRLAALERLASSDSEDSRALLEQEFINIESGLRTQSDFDVLEAALKRLRAFASRFHERTVALLEEFIGTIASRELTLPDGQFSGLLKKYKTAQSLVVKAIEILGDLRYLDTTGVFNLLLKLTRHSDGNVAKKALEELKQLAEFDLRVFYGDETSSGLGPAPQLTVVESLTTLSDEALLQNSGVILEIVPELLSPSMQGVSWSYKAVTISRGPTPALVGVAQLRQKAIALCKRMFNLAPTVALKRRALQCLVAATRREAPGDTRMDEMFIRDSVEVLDFFASIVPTGEMPVLQRIEHDSYWIYYHGAPEVKTAAIRVRDTIAGRGEYTIYKNVIGFEGIFGDWDELSRNDSSWENVDRKRREAADQYVDQITDKSFSEWLARILTFAETKSDDFATFPIFYYFLETLAKKKPNLAIQLVREHAAPLELFLIPIIRGLWQSELNLEMQGIAAQWVREGKFLTAIAKSLFGTGDTRLSFLSEITTIAAKESNIRTLEVVMGVASTLHGEGASGAAAIFMSALREMTNLKSAEWAFNFWHTREFRALIRELQPNDIADMLDNLQYLPKIDHHAEEVLYAIAERDPINVIRCLIQRLKQEKASDVESDIDEHYEAIPYRLHDLGKVLTKNASHVIGMLREHYDQDEYLFTYRGARLAHAIFPTFESSIEDELLRLVGRGEESDLYFVVAILRNYEGDPAIQRVCKAIIRTTPARSDLWNEIAAAMESTGVVHGQYGFAEAFERKNAEIAPWFNDKEPRVRDFAKWLSESLVKMAADDRRRADEEMVLRKYRYGAGKDA